MAGISGFTFVHNGMDSGYPFVEAIQAVKPYVDEMVAVDMKSTDKTRQVLKNLDCRIIDGFWEPGTGGACLAKNHALHVQCKGDTIWHFEADEVFQRLLAEYISHILTSGTQLIKEGREGLCFDFTVPRIQIAENFQRARWYPEWVHRIFPNGSVKKEGHTTDRHKEARPLDSFYGYLWDCPVTFRDNWIPRQMKQAELWGHDEPKFLVTPQHVNEDKRWLTLEEAGEYKKQEHWTWPNSPFAIPSLLRPCLGKVQYARI